MDGSAALFCRYAVSHIHSDELRSRLELCASSLDAVFATATKGTFYLADTSNNRVLKIEVDHVPVGSLFASIGCLNELGGGRHPHGSHHLTCGQFEGSPRLRVRTRYR